MTLMPAAAVLVHQLRFELAFGGRAGLELAQQGHAYLHSLVPWIVLVIAVGAGGFLWTMGRALAGQRSLARYAVSLAGLWALCTACLVAIYITQELLEGLLATGHPAAFAGVFGYGGWWSIPAAVCVGLVLASILHGARWVLDEVAKRRGSHALAARPATAAVAPLDVLLPRLSLAGRGWSQRGPPS